MYFLSTTAESLESARVDIIEEIVNGSKADVPFFRCELTGDPSVLGYFSTSQQFVARTALAVFPSLERNKPAEIVAGSFCDWRAPDIHRIIAMSGRLLVTPGKALRTYVSRLRYVEWARSSNVLPDMTYDEFNEVGEMEAICAAEGWPSAILALETVENDSPEKPKPELAVLYSPMVATPAVGLHSLQNALRAASIPT
jgi:hypothetical protein